MHPLVDRQLARSGLDPEAALEFRLMFSCAAALLKNSPAGPPGALDRLAALHGPDWGRFVNLLHENRLLIPALRASAVRSDASAFAITILRSLSFISIISKMPIRPLYPVPKHRSQPAPL